MSTLNTRKMQGCIPAASLNRMPHEKSIILQRLAVHLSTLPQWTNVMLSTGEVVVINSPFSPPVITSSENLLQWLDTTSNNKPLSILLE